MKQPTFILFIDAGSAGETLHFDTALIDLDRDNRSAQIEEQLDLAPWDVWQELPNTLGNRAVLHDLLAAMER